MDLIFRAICVLFQLCILLGSLQVVHAQNYRMEKFGVTDGLPSSEVYCVLQDRKGYMWFGTDRGAVRYNGYGFEMFTTDEGLPDNTVFKLFEDAAGRIWFGTFSPLLSYYEEGRIKPCRFNDKIEKLGISASVKADMAIGEDGTIYLGTINNGMITIDPEGNFTVDGYHKKGKCLLREGNYLVSIIGEKRSLDPDSVGSVFPKDKNFVIEVEPGQFRYEYEEESRLLPLAESARGPDGILALGLGYRVLYYVNGVKIWGNEYDKYPSQLFFDRKGRLWVGFAQGGVKVFDRKGNELPIFFPQLANYTISDIMQDRDGSFWFTTTQQGIFFLPSLKFRFLPFPENDLKAVTDLLCINDSLAYFAQKNLGFYSASLPDGSTWQRKGLHEKFVGATKIWWDKNANTLWLVNQRLYTYREGRLDVVPDLRITQGAKCFLLRRTGELWMGGRKGLFRSDGKVVEIFDDYLGRMAFWSLFEDREGQMWMGAHNGLYLYPSTGPVFSAEEAPELQKRISDIDQLPDGRLVVATLGGGISLIKGREVTVIREGDGLSSNLINCLAVDESGIVWAGSGRGLQRIDPSVEGKPLIRNYGLGSGMPFLEVHQVATSNKRVWLAGPEGIAVMDRMMPEDEGGDPPVFLRSLAINGRDTSLLPAISLSHRQNDIRISYIGLQYKGDRRGSYRYRMEGLDKKWRFTNDTVVSYPGLAPGKYAFEVAAGTRDGGWSESPARIVLEISPAFWQRWWFLPLILLLLLMFAGAITWYFLRQWQLRIRREKDLEQWKMKALRARMDPHFTFNILNTIQAYITTHDTLAAEKYLNAFSRLVRLVLHQSDTETIPLSEEVEMLELYLKLEQLRFSGKFEFEIVVDPALEIEFDRIPGMLVQPLAENAIKHGLLPRPEGGLIRILFSPENGNVRCKVSDTGIGREAARQLREGRTDEHRSAGLDLVRSRLLLIRGQNASGDPILITDLRDKHGNPAGTEISFIIPLKQ